jgi:hypothetical protein
MKLTLLHSEVAGIIGPELRRRGIAFRQEIDGDTISYIIINDDNLEVGAFFTSPSKTGKEMFLNCPKEDEKSLGKIFQVLEEAIWQEQKRRE